MDRDKYWNWDMISENAGIKIRDIQKIIAKLKDIIKIEKHSFIAQTYIFKGLIPRWRSSSI